MRPLRFSLLPGTWAIVRLPADAPVPAWAAAPAAFVSVTRTAHELSIVCPADAVPAGHLVEGDWALLVLHGPFAFSEVGVLASCAAPLAAAGISIVAISTFDTDYLLIRQAQASAACAALVTAGHAHVR